MASLLDYTFHHFELVWIHACVVVLAADRRCSGGSSSSSSDKKTEIGANRKYLAGIIMGERVLVTAVAASVDRVVTSTVSTGGGAGISSKRCSTLSSKHAQIQERATGSSSLWTPRCKRFRLH